MSLEEILKAYWNDDDPDSPEAEQLIIDYFVSKAPEKTIGAPVNQYETGSECDAYADGFNQAVETYTRALQQLFESEEPNHE